MAMSSLLNGSYGSGGSWNVSNSASNSWSHSAGNAASLIAQQAAANANNQAMSAWQAAANFNSEEAEKQRQWLEYMANTVYQRTTKDMKAAGINPILAAGMGLGTASVGSGAQASMSAPNTYMSNTYPEQNSASTANSHGEGAGWNESQSGLATALTQIAALFTGALNNMSSGVTINNIMREYAEAGEKYNDNLNKINSKKDKWSDYRNKVTDNNRRLVNENKLLQMFNNAQIKATYGR